MKLSKKGAVGVNTLLPLGILFVVVAIAFGLGAQVLGEIQDDQVADTYEYNASQSGLQAVDELAGWLPTIGLVVAAAIIIGVVITFLAARR